MAAGGLQAWQCPAHRALLPSSPPAMEAKAGTARSLCSGLISAPLHLPILRKTPAGREGGDGGNRCSVTQLNASSHGSWPSLYLKTETGPLRTAPHSQEPGHGAAPGVGPQLGGEDPFSTEVTAQNRPALLLEKRQPCLPSWSILPLWLTSPCPTSC